ncbi:MAG: FMN-binding protein [Bacteroidetes bacterium]|nr:FMN-binding protein [Bacteroidota bacterium]MBU1579860.1 FMN-binding protein [Bacteroidota bacterium]MBU2465532.1 FMN-binding protein [Bacteroidota bacterium]MBU2556911.1 FMN-binding protein [Bacteroidota bacterium]
MKNILILIFNINLLLFLPPAGAQEQNFPRSLEKDIRKQLNLKQAEFQQFKDSKAMPAGNFYSVIANGETQAYLYLGRVFSCRSGGCSIANAADKTGDKEYFDYYIFFDTTASVQYIRIFNYAATHGHEITAKWWLKQFFGYRGNSSLQVGKNIDAVSGATISTHAMTDDVQFITEQLSRLMPSNSPKKQEEVQLKSLSEAYLKTDTI